MASVLSLPRAAPARLPPAVPRLPVRRFTVGEYMQLIEIGMLTEDDDVELIEGWIVPKMPRNPPHDSAIRRTSETLRQTLTEGWVLSIQSAIVTSESAPEPDVAVVKGPLERYDDEHPTAADVALVIEVANTSLMEDRTVKAGLYARAGIPIYWIVNTKDRQVEVFSKPNGTQKKPAYKSHKIAHMDDEVDVVIAGKLVGRVPVAALVPQKKSGKTR